MFDYKGKVEGAFDSFAETYDNIIGQLMTSFADLLVRDLQIPENPIVLDVGCGTGISTFTLMKRVQGKGNFYGIDISQRMIDLAKARAADLGYSNVTFSKGDAEQLNFPESSFDVVISNQTFLFLPNKQKAVNEMFRVLTPMGHMALLFFGEQTGREIDEIYNKIRNRHPEHALPESLKLISLEETQELLDQAGFQTTRTYGIHQIYYTDTTKYNPMVDSPQAPWSINMPSDSSSELVEMVRKEIKEEMTKAKTDKGFKMTVYNVIAHAQKT